MCQILRMVTIQIVINSTRVMGIRVSISCRYCIAFEVMLLFLVGYVVSILIRLARSPHTVSNKLTLT